MLQKKCKIIVISLLVLLFTVAMSGAAFAAEAHIDLGQQGQISVTLKDTAGNHPPIPGGTFVLYPVADLVQVNGQLVYHYNKNFENCGVSLGNLHAEGLAKHLAGYAVAQNLSGTEKTAGKDGKVTFTNLDLGVYLVTQQGSVPGYYSIAPFLVSLPMTSEDGDWVYDVNASPKTGTTPGGGGGGDDFTKMTVKKVWQDANSENRPASITVHLMKDGEIYETITLSDKNGWSYSWKTLDANHRWSVVEADVPDGYIAQYEENGLTLIITNSIAPEIPDEPTPGGDTPDEPGNPEKPNVPDEDIPDEPTPGTTVPGEPVPNPTGPSLIQTGQLNWPIPVLTIAGVLLFSFGWVQYRKREHHES